MKKKNNDFEFIASKFNEENLQTPESLSEQAMWNKINSGEKANTVVKMGRKTNRVKATIAVAACFIMLLAAGTGVYSAKINIPKPVAGMTGITSFGSYGQLEKTIKDINKKNNVNMLYSIMYGDGGFNKSTDTIENSETNTSEAPTAATDENAVGFGGTPDGTDSYAVTNKQVEAVDEADIIKTDGKYIYYMPGEDVIKIFSANDGDTALVSEIELPYYLYSGDMYVRGDKLLVIGSYYYDDCYGDDAILYRKAEEPTEAAAGTVPAPETVYDETVTIVYTYDISDRTTPVLTEEYAQSGYYISSRMIGGYLYLISNAADESLYAPRCTADSEFEKLPIGNIVAVDGCDHTDFAVIGAIDTENGGSTQTKAILGVSSDVYCNEKNLYLTGDIYESSNNTFNYTTNYQTQVIKYSVDKTDIELVASARVDGLTNDQFSLDEKDGNLRIATTSTDSDWVDSNNLFVLDESLNEIGKVTGFAENEHIEAVRYVGDTAYVITFVQTDPLFVIDLSDPTAPAIQGEVKIDGFSSFLTPVDENTLLGIGYCTEENGYGGVYTDGVKLALFDVSDKTNPQVLDEKEYPGTESAAQYTHKALIKNSKAGYFAIPLYVYDYAWDEYGDMINISYPYQTGALKFEVKNGELEVENLTVSDNNNAGRCTYIGNYLYVLSTDGANIDAFFADGSDVAAPEQQNDDTGEARDVIQIASDYVDENSAYSLNQFERIEYEYFEEYQYTAQDYSGGSAAEKTLTNIYAVYFMPGDDVAGGDLTVILDADSFEVVDTIPGE